MARHDLFIDKWVVYLGETTPHNAHINVDYLVYCLRYRNPEGINPYLTDDLLVVMEQEYALLQKHDDPYPKRINRF